MKKPDTKPALRVALLASVYVAVVLVLTVFLAVWIGGFQWGLLLNAFRLLWPLLVGIVLFTYLLVFFAARYPLGTVSIVLLMVGFLFLLASPKGNDFGQRLNSAIYRAVDVNLLVGAFTVFALILALFTIFKEREGKR